MHFFEDVSCFLDVLLRDRTVDFFYFAFVSGNKLLFEVVFEVLSLFYPALSQAVSFGKFSISSIRSILLPVDFTLPREDIGSFGPIQVGHHRYFFQFAQNFFLDCYLIIQTFRFLQSFLQICVRSILQQVAVRKISLIHRNQSFALSCLIRLCFQSSHVLFIVLLVISLFWWVIQ